MYLLLAKSATEEYGGVIDADGVETENNSTVNSIIEAICSDEANQKTYESLLDEMQQENSQLR
jgi:hypothetical protein